jgi:MYXO-CTERM domain-containing protein
MKRSVLTLLVAFVTLSGSAAAAATQYSVQLTLDGGAEGGTGTFTYESTTGALQGTVTHSVTAANTSYLAVQPPGGSVTRLVDTFGGSSPISVSTTLDADAGDVTALGAGNVRFAVQNGSETYDGPLVEVPATADAGSGTDAGKDAGGPTTTPTPNPKTVTDAGTTSSSGGGGDSGGCSATSAGVGTGTTALGLGLGALLAVALVSRRRPRRGASRSDS